MRDQSEVIPGDYSPRRVELPSYAPKHRLTVEQACKVLQDNHRPLYTCIIPSEPPVRDRLFVLNKTNNIQVKLGGSGG